MNEIISQEQYLQSEIKPSLEKDLLLVAELEETCRIFFRSQNNQERENAHQRLIGFFEKAPTTEKLIDFIMILQSSSDSYTLILTCNAICGILHRKWSLFTEKIQEELNLFLIRALIEKAHIYMQSQEEKSIILNLIKVLALLTKIFFDYPSFGPKIISNLKTFFIGEIIQYLVGLKIIEALVTEIQAEEKGDASSKFKRTMIDFKDKILPSVVDISFEALLKWGDINFSSNLALEEEYITNCLNLIHITLNFNFVGETKDIDENKFKPLLIPWKVGWSGKRFENSQWRILRRSEIVNLFFEIYLISEANGRKAPALLCLQILSSLCRIRINFFENSANQINYILFIIKGLKTILHEKKGFADTELLREFTNVVSKTNRNLSMDLLIENPEYIEWLEDIYKITCEAIHMEDPELEIIGNFLEFWSYFVYYINTKKFQKYEDLRPPILEILFEYLNTKYFSILKIVSGDPRAVVVQEHIVQIAKLSDLCYENVIDLIQQKIELLLNEVEVNNSIEDNILYIGGLIDLSAKIIFTKMKAINQKLLKEDECIGEEDLNTECSLKRSSKFISYILSISKKFDELQASTQLEPSITFNVGSLQTCILKFMKKFCKVIFFVGNNKIAKNVIDVIAKELAKSKFSEILGYFLIKIPVMFKSQSQLNITLANKLLQTLIKNIRVSINIKACEMNFALGKIFFDLNVFDLLFSEELLVQSELDNKERKIYTTSLSTLVFKQFSISPNQMLLLENFFTRFKLVMGELGSYDSAGMKGETLYLYRNKLQILNCELFGILMSTENGVIYDYIVGMIVHGKFLDTCRHYSVAHPEDDKTINLILKLMQEIIFNRYDRITQSPGHPLFRKLCDLIQTLSQIILAKQIEGESKTPEQIYRHIIKAASYCFKCFSRLVNSRIVNVKLLKSYKDKDLYQTINSAVTLLFTIQPEQMIHYIKRMKNAFEMLETLSLQFPVLFLSLGNQSFRQVLLVQKDGIQSFDNCVCIYCFEFISNIIGFYLNDSSTTAEEKILLKDLFDANSDILQGILRVSFTMILNGENTNLSYFSKMILGLIHIQQNYFLTMLAQLSDYNGEHRKLVLEEAFVLLAQNIPPDYRESSCEKFVTTLKDLTKAIEEKVFDM